MKSCPSLGAFAVIAVGAMISPIARAQPAPVVDAYPALYRLDHGHWKRSLLFTPGDRVRFVMPFFTPQPGWSFPHGTFAVQRKRVPFYAQPLILRRSLVRRRGARGYTIFSTEFRIMGRRWLGHWIAEATIAHGQATITPTFYFAVRPHLPTLYTVVDANTLCRTRPLAEATITVGGVWAAVNEAGPDRLASGWIAPHWVGRGRIPHWWRHGVLRIVFPPGTNLTGPPDGFLQVRARLDCPAHMLTAVHAPVMP